MHLAKLVVFGVGMAWRLLRGDPRRALRLALRLLRLRSGPAPRDPQREARDLAASLESIEKLAIPPRSVRDVRFHGNQHIAPGSDETGEAEVAGAFQEATVLAGTRVMHLVTNALPHTSAGYTIRTHRIAMAQRAMGLEPHVVTRLGYPLTQGIPDAHPLREVDGIPYHRLLPWIPPSGPADAVSKGSKHASRLVKRLRPQVLHAASNHQNAAVALELRERHGLPVVYEVRGFLEDSWLSRDPAHSADSAFYTRTRELETRCMQAADLIVTLGEAMREEIASRGVNRAKISTVPNGVDDAFLEPLPDGTALRRRLGLREDSVVVGLTSTLYGFEGIGTLIDAAALLRERGAPVELLLVGDGPCRAELETRAAERDVRAVFPGRVPFSRVREFHAALDIFAVPRTADRVCQMVTPLKPLEAMAGGIPVIASDVKALREIIEPELTGTLTLPEDSEAWANSLEELIYSPVVRRELGNAAREWVASHRTWRHVTARYASVYRELM